MGLRYFDTESGRERIKRRYVWAFWGFVGGLAGGLVLSSLMH